MTTTSVNFNWEMELSGGIPGVLNDGFYKFKIFQNALMNDKSLVDGIISKKDLSQFLDEHMLIDFVFSPVTQDTEGGFFVKSIHSTPIFLKKTDLSEKIKEASDIKNWGLGDD